MKDFITNIIETLIWQSEIVIVNVENYSYFLHGLRTIAQNFYDFEVHYLEIVKPTPESAYETILNLNFTQISSKTIVVINDLVYYMNNPGILRKIVSLKHLLAQKQQKLIILNEFYKIPEHIADLFPVFNEEKPEPEEIVSIVEMVGEKFGYNFSRTEINEALPFFKGLTRKEVIDLSTKLVRNQKKSEDRTTDFKTFLYREKVKILSEKRGLITIPIDDSITQLGGLAVFKDWILKREKIFVSNLQNMPIDKPKGVLLLGVQGCGKSLSVKVIAKTWKIPLFYFDFSKIVSGEKSNIESLKATLQTVEDVSPCVLWIDEMDKLFSLKNFQTPGLLAAFGYFLTYLQEKKSSVFVAATANSIEGMPPELLRKGRFDEIFFIDLPDLYEREEIFKIHLKKRKQDPSRFDVRELAKSTNYFTGAEIEQVIVSALINSFFEKKPLSQMELLKEIKNTNPIYFTYEEKIKEFRHWAKKRARFASEKRDIMAFFEKKDG